MTGEQICLLKACGCSKLGAEYAEMKSRMCKRHPTSYLLNSSSRLKQQESFILPFSAFQYNNEVFYTVLITIVIDWIVFFPSLFTLWNSNFGNTGTRVFCLTSRSALQAARFFATPAVPLILAGTARIPSGGGESLLSALPESCGGQRSSGSCIAGGEILRYLLLR